MKVRGVRGANRAKANSREAIFEATRELITAILDANEIDPEEIASIFLTATKDLNADFPAYAVRELGYSQIPLLCASEIDVPGGMQSLIRVLIHANTDKSQNEIRHVYLGGSDKLRPDLFGSNE
jgi:chorismate mutase